MEKVLIVDDEKSIRITLGEFLKREGYEVKTADEAETALNMCREDCFDIILSDILLPKISGIDLLDKLMKICPASKVIMITGEPNISSATEALRLGACDYLFKPVNKETVIKSVNNAVRIKKLEEENTNYQANLENLVAERTEELETAMEEMRVMQKELLKRERLKGLDLISSGIAHDINNSLSPIMIYSETLMEKLKDIDQSLSEYVLNIISSAEKIEKSIKKIENFHFRVNGSSDEHRQININSVLEKTDELLRSQNKLPHRNIEFFLQTEQKLPAVCGNEEELRQVFYEISVNSIDASPENGTIRIRSFYKNGRVNITVEDEGSGMTEEQLERCCDPYYSTKGPGSNGLGLSMVYGMICRHAGEMHIESEAGTGTKITISFPALTEFTAAQEQEGEKTV